VLSGAFPKALQHDLAHGATAFTSPGAYLHVDPIDRNGLELDQQVAPAGARLGR
jgi:hypothetical protein